MSNVSLVTTSYQLPSGEHRLQNIPFTWHSGCRVAYFARGRQGWKSWCPCGDSSTFYPSKAAALGWADEHRAETHARIPA